MVTIAGIYEDIQNGVSIEKLHKKYGGLTIYIPKTVPDYKEKIIKEFSGNNHALLAHKYNVSIKTVYQVLRDKNS